MVDQNPTGVFGGRVLRRHGRGFKPDEPISGIRLSDWLHTGLGIEAQRQALAHFAQSEGFMVAREFAR
jgi:hypothetical protein